MENGAFIDVNEAYLTYFNLERQDLIGHRSQELDLPLEPGIRAQVISQLQQDDILRNLELEIVLPTGENRTILASLQRTSVDGTQALILAFIDITERVYAEQQIRALASELTMTEQAERHRLAQVLHDDLQQRIFAVQMNLSFLKDAYEKNDLKAFAVDFPEIEVLAGGCHQSHPPT